MTRFFFHIRDQQGGLPDDEGMVLGTLAEAKEEARVIALDIAKHHEQRGQSLEDACVEICAEDGSVVAVLSVQEVLAHPGSPQFGEDS